MSSVNQEIWPPFEAFYINSMLFNALSAMESISRVADVIEALQALTPEEMREALDRHSFLDELQNIVLQGGALSRYFWPSRKDSTARGERRHSWAAVRRLSLRDERGPPA